MVKRKKFILTSVLLSLGFIGIQFLPDQYRFLSIGGLSVLTLILFYWSLREGLNLNLTLLALVLPFFFTIGVGLFWFLLPTSIFTQIPIVIIYGIGIYVLCLTSNIFTVSAIRTIALSRSARSVGFVITLFTLFLLYDAILSVKWSFYITGLAVFLISLPLFMQGFWSILLDKNISKKLLSTTLVASLVVGEIALILHFWPVTLAIGSLFLTVASYVLLGLGQAELEGRLFAQTIREYLIVGVMVFLGMFFVTSWRG